MAGAYVILMQAAHAAKAAMRTTEGVRRIEELLKARTIAFRSLPTQSDPAPGKSAAAAARSYDSLVKCVLVGDSGVGKSCLLLRLVDDTFSSSYMSTIGVDFKLQSALTERLRVKMQIWDTAGQERFLSVTTSYYRGAFVIAVVVDLTDRETFASVQRWMSLIQQHASDNVSVLLIGNKADIVESRDVSRAEMETLAATFDCPYVETSAKANHVRSCPCQGLAALSTVC
jgi:small GTP-binding protein